MYEWRVAAMFSRNFEQKKPTRVLVLNLVEISKDFLLLISII